MTASKSMAGRRCIVTGANSGIGKATAVELAKMGASVVMVCRNPERGEAAKDEAIRISGNPSVTLVVADFLSRGEVRRAVTEITSSGGPVHVLVNNAGSNFPGYSETEDGAERTMALNYYAPFIFTNLLRDALLAGSPSRVVNVSSDAHFRAKLDLADINGRSDQGMFGLRAYGRSKLALTLFTYELARRMRDTGVTSNCVHPGAVRTGIWSHSGGARPLVAAASLFMRSPEKGAETVVYLASSPEVEGATGGYYRDLKARRSSRTSYDEGLAARLWQSSAEATGLGS